MPERALRDFIVLALVSRRDLNGRIESDVVLTALHAGGRIVLGGIGCTAIALLVASTFAVPLGMTTFACGVIIFLVACIRERSAFASVVRSVSWTVPALVADFFVFVRGLETTGLPVLTRRRVEALVALPPVLSVLGAAFTTAAASNLMNNLPAGLIAGSSVATLHGHDALRSALAIGIDLGTNLSVTGSLATVPWLIALRREHIDVTAWKFLRVGALVMPPALVLAVLGVLITSR